MSSPLLDANTAPNQLVTNQTPRQRLESTLDKLPPAGSAAAQSESAQPAIIARSELVKPVQRINEVLHNFGLEFQISEPGHRLVTRVIDRESGEVIRQIPSEEVLRIAENLEQLNGVLLHQTA